MKSIFTNLTDVQKIIATAVSSSLLTSVIVIPVNRHFNNKCIKETFKTAESLGWKGSELCQEAQKKLDEIDFRIRRMER